MAVHYAELTEAPTSTYRTPSLLEIVAHHCNKTENPEDVIGYTFNGELQLLEQFLPASIWMMKIFVPIWYCLGIPGNLLAAYIWIQKRMRRASSGVYLAALSLCHTLFLLLHMPFALSEYWGYNTISYPVFCNLYPLLFHAMQYSSPILVLCFTAERYISVVHPFRRERLCTPRRAFYVTLGVLLFCLAMGAPQAYFYFYNFSDKGPSGCQVRKSVFDYTNNANYGSIYAVWALVSEILIFAVVPLTVLVINILVLREVHRLRRLHSSESSHRKATTATLLSVSFYLIGSLLPVTISYLLSTRYSLNLKPCWTKEELLADVGLQQYFRFKLARNVVEIIGLSHFAVNFYIYLATGKMFRRLCFHTVARIMCKQTQLRHFSGREATPSEGAPLRSLGRNMSLDVAPDSFDFSSRRRSSAQATCLSKFLQTKSLKPPAEISAEKGLLNNNNVNKDCPDFQTESTVC